MAQQQPSSGAQQDLRKPMSDKRKKIIKGIRSIQPVAGKNLRDVEVPRDLYILARVVAEEESIDSRFCKVPVYQLLLNHVRGKQGSADPSQVEATLAGWQQASKALFRYALNLVLAPKRPEFKKMKLSSSFYVYNISRNLHGAEQVFLAMGYQVVERQGRGGQDLVYEGDVKPAPVLETATDLLVMHEEVGFINELVDGGRGGHMTLEEAIIKRWQTNPAHGTNTAHDTRSAGTHPQPQTQPPAQPQAQSQLRYPLSIQGGGAEGSYFLSNDMRGSGGIPPQPHSQAYGQPPQPVASSQSQPTTAQGYHGMGGYERGVYAVLPLDPSVAAAQRQQPPVPFYPEHENLHDIAKAARQGGKNAPLTARGDDQQQYVAGCSTREGVVQANPPSQTHAQQWQADPYFQGHREPQGVDHHPGQAPPAPAPGPVSGEPPPNATFYQNVHYQNSGSESAIYQNASDILQPHANSEVNNLENITVTKQMRKLFQQYPQLAGLSPQQKDTRLPALDDDTLDIYSDDSNPVPVDSQPLPVETQSVPPTQEEPYSFDLGDLPGPMVHFSASTPVSTSVSTAACIGTPGSEFPSGITSSLVHSRSSGECGRFSPVEEQPRALGDEVNDLEYQRQLQQQVDGTEYQQQLQQQQLQQQHSDAQCEQQVQHDNRQGRSPSTDSSIDLYGSAHSETLQRHLSKESIDLYSSGSADKLGKALHPVHEEPENLPSDPVPTHPSPSPHSTAHPLEMNTQQRPALQVQDSQEDTPHPIEADREKVKKPVPTPRGLKQAKSHSVDEVEQDGEGKRMKHHVMRTSASGSDLLQYERHSQPSEPRSPRRLDPPIPRPRKSPTPSPRSSAENSPSTSPTPPRRKVPPIPEHPSQPPGHQLAVGMPPKAQSVDTETPRREEIREKNPVDRFSSGDLKAAVSALAQTSQASPPLRRVPESPPTQRSSCDLPPNVPVMGISPYVAAAKLKKQRDGSNPPSDQLPPSQLSSGRPSSVSSGQAGQPALSQALSQPSSGQQSSGQPPNHPSWPPPDPQRQAQSQPPQGQQPASQPPSGQPPGRLRPSQPLQDQPLQNKQPTIQPSPDEPGQPRSQQSQHRQPPSELPTTHAPPHAPPDRSSLSPPGPLQPKSAPSLSASTVAAETADTSESDQSDLDQHRPNRSSIESLEKNLGQDTSKLRRQEHVRQPEVRKRSNAISEPSHPCPKSTELNSSAEDEGVSTSTATTTTELEEHFQFSLGETWICSYCTNLVKTTQQTCDVCGREKLGTVV